MWRGFVAWCGFEKTKSLFCLRDDPLIGFRRQNHVTFIFIKNKWLIPTLIYHPKRHDKNNEFRNQVKELAQDYSFSDVID